MAKKSVEETYQKMSPRDHVLNRPETYVGSVGMETTKVWVMPPNGTQFEYREINYVPALYKIFDEVLVNAADNYQRSDKMNTLKVEVNREEGYVSVSNNGKGIPVEIHKEYNIYVPELIFGHLLTGSNYDDGEKRVVGGRNGYGAKLANIFSKKFIVECGDKEARKKFRMVWTNNMDQHSDAEIEKYTQEDFTKVTFYPDFKRFKMDGFDDDIFSLFTKRAYDMAGVMPKVKVYINGKDVTVNSFVKYVNLYFDPNSEAPKVRDNEVDNDRWQVVLSTSDGEFKQVSFVNSICTSRGGSHVDYITNQIVAKIQEKIKKKDKNLDVKPFQIKNHLWVFINCLIVNPTFDSQTKETLKLKVSDFGSTCILSDRMIKNFLSTGVVDEIFNEAKAKEMNKLSQITKGKKTQRIQGVPKLEDANEAGGRNSDKCVLILTEGDSAKSLAMAGLEVIGRDYFGVFPLRGKLLNVREANSNTIMKNEEIQNIIKIMGLQIAKKYDDLKQLRYGSIMIMSDQDTDGSHIKGLVINFIHHFWPSLFRINGFIKQFITPLLKATKGTQVIPFYTMGDFKAWADQQENLKAWKIKYYKGLGTSSDKEAKEYFEQIARHRLNFQYIDENDDASIDLIFNKKNADKRKEWLSTYDPTLTMVYDRDTIRYKEFVDKEFIHFSNEDNARSIASIIDGFKPGQRKIIYACFKRNLKEEIKVAQLAGYVAEHSAYHHGEMSLTQTIVGMAQNFVGSNNINLLMPNGQFGSRNQGGKDHASARYIFTCLNRITRYIFPEPDDHTLTYIEDDGQLVEPEYYIPIIPMSLVNGCDGIGTGWSTNVPNFNPRELAELILQKLEKDEPFRDIHPWYKGFIGQIIPKQDMTSYDVQGIIEIDPDNNIVHIKELPIGKWIKDHKEMLEELMKNDERIIGFREYHTRQRVHFEIEMDESTIEKYQNDTEYFAKLFKTTGSISMKNVVGFNSEKKLHRYSRISELMEQFYAIRLRYYELRKSYLLSKLERDLLILSNKERFILEVIEEKLVIRNVKKVKICETLKERGYTKFNDFPKVKSTKVHGNKKKDEEGDDDEEEGEKKDSITDYNYLLNLPLLSLSFEKVEEIKKQRIEKKNEFDALQNTKISEIWKADILEFLKVLDEVEKEELESILEEEKKKGKGNAKMQKNRKRPEKEKVKKDKKDGPINWDSESETSVHKKKPEGKKGGGGKKNKDDDDYSTEQKLKKEKGKEKDKDKGKEKKKQESESKSKSKSKEKDRETSKDSDEESFMARINKKFSQKTESKSNGESEGSLDPVVLLRPKNKLKTLKEAFDQEESDYEVEQAYTKSKKSVSKKKRQLDSDEEFEGESDEDDD